MNSRGPWHTDDFEALLWHDCHVHGFALDTFDESEGTADLSLDLDYILEWIPSGLVFKCVVTRAELRFHDVFGLRFALDYETPGAGMCPFAIDHIDRERTDLPNCPRLDRWTVAMAWPTGSIDFTASGFNLTLLSEPRTQDSMWLEAEHRGLPGAT